MLSNSRSLDWSTMGKLLHLDLMSMSMYWLAVLGFGGHEVCMGEAVPDVSPIFNGGGQENSLAT